MEKFDYKQVIAVRTDLKMDRGKLAVQASHAAVSTSEVAKKRRPKWWQNWFNEGQCKIAVKVKTLDKLLELKKAAEQKNLPNSLITDRGLTQLPPGTVTCLGIGPAPSIEVDKLTATLPLL